MNILESIMAERRADVATARRDTPLQSLEKHTAHRTRHSLADRLRRSGTHIIAEMKKASPSAGLLREDYRPVELGRLYTEAGACGLSILTEPRHFKGSGEHLQAVRTCTDLPILRKDFICDEYQLYEAAAWGADVVLLIVAALDRTTLERLYAQAVELRLEVLAESHTAEELKIALSLPEAIVGINSRNLKTLKTDLETARQLADAIPADRLAIAESGIRTRDDIVDLEARGYAGFLVGESIVGSQDPAAQLAALLGK